MFDVRAYNRDAWNKQVDSGCVWSRPVDHDVIEKAKKGDWEIVLTPLISVPNNWYPDFKGKNVLCLASGGGQQAPILAAAGGLVTSFDNSPQQLAQDHLVAQREGLSIEIVEGDMRDLSVLADEQFTLIFHPVSNIFVPDVLPVWKEAFRVLEPGGVLLSGLVNPINYIFDIEKYDHEKILEVRHKIPYNDIDDLPKDVLEKFKLEKTPLEFSHTLEELIGGQIQAGFSITGFYEDKFENDLMSEYYPTFFATRAIKPR
ncbi:MAG: methyltransferase domain-containing protein [Anaerolineaceae bacterium]